MNKWRTPSEPAAPPASATAPDSATAAAGVSTAYIPPSRETALADATARIWRGTLLVLVVSLVGLTALFADTATQIAQVWWQNDAYNHGMFIVPISVFLIWRMRRKLSHIAPRPTVWGVAGMAAAAVGWLLGNVAGVLVVEQFSFVLMLQALILAIVGWRVLWAALFPIMFLLFAIPFGEFLIPPLQDFTAFFTVRALQLSGIPVFLEGLFIQIPAATFEVAAACSGSRFLITSVTLGALVANQFYHTTWRRVLFMVLAVLVPIVANGFRAYGLVMIAHLSGLEFAVGADHVTFGLIFLSIVIVLLLLAGALFREKTSRPAPAVPNTSPARPIVVSRRLPKLIATAVAAILVAGSAAAYAPIVENRGVQQATLLDLAPPVVGADWQRVDATQSRWRPVFVGASDEQVWSFAKDGETVDVYAAFYPYQRQDSEIVGWRNRFADDKIWQQFTTVDRTVVELEGQTQDVLRTHLRGLGKQRLVLYWYWIDGRFEADPRVAKLRQLKTQLMGGDQSAAVIAVATDYSETPDEAMARLRAYLADSPSFERIVAGTQTSNPATIANKSSGVCPGGQRCAE